jgi:ribosomal protein S18 acetylase RimI-like enzyme
MNRFLPHTLRPDVRSLFPSDARQFGGPALAWWATAAFLVLVTGRSLVHLLAEDGGATSIATIDTSVEGGSNIIALFGQWGASQLLLALLLWVLLLRYRGLTPLVILVLALEPVLRGVAGQLKPIETIGTAPGEALNWLALPVLLALLWLSLCPADKKPAARA